MSASTMGPGGPGPGGGRQPTEAEVRAYMEQLRAVPVEGVIAELVELVLSAAQVKIGRPDARLLADLLAVVADAIAGRVDPQLHEGITGALARLRVAQVEAERALAAEPGAGAPGAPPSEPGAAATPPPAAPPPATPGGGPSGPDPRASRLWVPGR